MAGRQATNFLLFAVQALFLQSLLVSSQNVYVTTVMGRAGTYAMSMGDAQATSVAFGAPWGLVFDPAKANLYIGDVSYQMVRKLNIATSIVKTVAGGAAGAVDAQGTYATFNNLHGISMDSGNIYAADYNGNRIRKISPTGAVSSVAGDGTQSFGTGPALTAKMYSPGGCYSDSIGNLFIAVFGSNRIQMLSSAVISLYGGSGAASSVDGFRTVASFYAPTAITVDPTDNVVVADWYGNKIRRIDKTTGQVTTLVGTGAATSVDGPGTVATTYGPEGLSYDQRGNLVFAESQIGRVRRLSTAGVVKTLAGGANGFSDGYGTVALFFYPRNIATDLAGNVFVADYNNYCVRKVSVCDQGFNLATKSCECPAGNEMSSNGACTQCSLGYFSASASNQACQECAAGTESSADRQSCTDCVSGKYRSLGMPSCSTCS